MVINNSKKLSEIDGDKIQEAIDAEDKETFFDNLIKFINNGCRFNYILANVFMVGDIFRQRATKGDTRMDISGNTEDWIIKPNLKRMVQVRNDLGNLSEYVLPENMDDTRIQEGAGNPGCMDLDTFFCVSYLLIFQPQLAKQVLGYELKKDKWYLFHVLVNGKKVAVGLYWDGDEWRWHAGDFDDGRDWSAGDVLLFFATAKK